MDNSHRVTKSGARGTKLVRETGLDNSSAGPKGTGSLNPKMGGGRDSLAHSITSGSVRKK